MRLAECFLLVGQRAIEYVDDVYATLKGITKSDPDSDAEVSFESFLIDFP